MKRIFKIDNCISSQNEGAGDFEVTPVPQVRWHKSGRRWATEQWSLAKVSFGYKIQHLNETLSFVSKSL